MKKILFTLTCLLSIAKLEAQEMWGISNSNYAGTMGHDLNPASIVGTPFRWELHFMSTDASMMNNYMYLKRNSRAIRMGVRGESVDDERVTDKYTTTDKNAYSSAYTKLPSLMYSTPKWGLGFHISTRMGLSARGVPYHLAKFMKEGFDYAPQQGIHYTGGDMAVVGMNWHEAGITGGVALVDDQVNYLTAGVTLNYLYGLNSFYMLLDDINYNVQSDSLWQIYIANVEYGHATPGEEGNAASEALKKKGSGIGGSVGILYYKNRNENAYNPCVRGKSEKKYDYKLGVSLIDIGKINFTTNAHQYIFSDVSTDWYGIDTVKAGGINSTDSLLNSQFYGAIDAGLAATSYSLWTPAAASVQFDYAYSEYIYFNISAIQRLPLGDYIIKRANQISITPRFETKNFEVAMPYSFYDYQHHRIGLAIRYGVLTVGTDMLGPFTGMFDAYGVDFYMGIKWQITRGCDRKPAKVKKGGTSCYDDF